MVCFEDLHVVSVTERARSRLDKPERDVHAHRHVRRLYDRDLSRRGRDAFILLRGETGHYDHNAHALLQALLQVRERTFSTGKIDQAVAFRNCVGKAGSELQIPRCEGHLDQGTPHTAPSAGDDELHCSRFPGDAAATTSPSTRFIFPSSKNTAMRRYSISRLLAR